MTSEEIYAQYLEAKRQEERDDRLSELYKQGVEAGEQLKALIDGLVAGGLTENQAVKIIVSQYVSMCK
jgi:hypothetical protein